MLELSDKCRRKCDLSKYTSLLIVSLNKNPSWMNFGEPVFWDTLILAKICRGEGGEAKTDRITGAGHDDSWWLDGITSASPSWTCFKISFRLSKTSIPINRGHPNNIFPSIFCGELLDLRGVVSRVQTLLFDGKGGKPCSESEICKVSTSVGNFCDNAPVLGSDFIVTSTANQ